MDGYLPSGEIQHRPDCMFHANYCVNISQSANAAYQLTDVEPTVSICCNCDLVYGPIQYCSYNQNPIGLNLHLAGF